MNLNEWAIRWGVPYAAVDDLRRLFGMVNTDPAPVSPDNDSEANAQSLIRLEASKKGLRLWRNNVGDMYHVQCKGCAGVDEHHNKTKAHRQP